jgi:hypothetical protein
MAASYDDLLATALAWLLIHYRSRFCAVALCCRPADRTAAFMALRQEQNAAVANLRVEIRGRKREALMAIRTRRGARPAAGASPRRGPLSDHRNALRGQPSP